MPYVVTKRFSLPVLVVISALAVAAVGQTGNESAAEFYEDAVIRLENGDVLGAIIQLRNSLQQDLEYVAAWTLLAETYLRSGDAPFAISAAEKALELKADERLLAVTLAQAYLMIGDYAALAAMKPKSGMPPARLADFYVIQGNALLEAHELVAAEKKFAAALESKSDHAGAMRGLALVTSRKGRIESALGYAEKALEKDADDAENWYVRGEVRRAGDRIEAALDDFKRAAAINPQHAPAILARAAILADRGELSKALELLLEYQSLAPDELQGLHLLAQVQMTLGDDVGAGQALEKARTVLKDIAPAALKNNLPALMTGALLAFRDDTPQIAKGNLEAYLARVPGHRAARRLLAVANLRLGNPSEARRLLEKLANERPTDQYLAVLLATAYALEGNADAAEQTYSKAPDVGASGGWMYNVIGMAQARKGQFNRALAAFEHAMGYDKERVDARLMSAFMQLQLGHIEDAARTVAVLISADPLNPLYQNLAGALALIDGDVAAASVHFEQALDTDPRYLAARLNLAEIDRRQGRIAAARERYAAILKDNPREIGALRGLAELAAAQTDTQTAISWLERIRKVAPTNISDRLALLNAYRLAGRFAEAVIEAQHLRRLAGDQVDVVVAAAMAEAKGGSIAHARSLLIDYANKSSPSAATLELIAATQASLNFSDDATETRRRILDEDTAFLPTRYELVRENIRRHKLAEARQHLKVLHEHHPDATRTAIAEGELAMAERRYADAARAYEQAMAQAPRLGIAKRQADALIELGKVDEGLALLAARVDRFPDDDQELLALAAAQLKAGRRADAAASYEALAVRDPKNWLVHNNLAWIYFDSEDPRALAQARRALDARPDHPAVLDTAGWILARSGNLAEAVPLLREAAARDSTHEQISLHLGEALLEYGRLDEARRVLTSVRNSATAAVAQHARSLLAKIAEEAD